MNAHILEVLQQIEQDYDLKILFACESGSRAWGFPSKDSDYDVRFIYVQKMNWYLAIDQKRDCLEIPKQDSLTTQTNPLLDLSGWELTKALRLFRKSNPPLLEWLNAKIVYYQAFSTIHKMQSISNEIFSPTTCIFHYLNMAKGNYRECLLAQEVRIKQYLNALRPVLAAKWIEKHQSFPPNDTQSLLADIIHSSELKDSIGKLIKEKQKRENSDLINPIEMINQFLDIEINHLEGYVKNLKVVIQDSTPRLNKIFRETLVEVWE